MKYDVLVNDIEHFKEYGTLIEVKESKKYSDFYGIVKFKDGSLEAIPLEFIRILNIESEDK